MRQNRVKRVMREGGLAIVSHIGFADPAVVEIIALAGFDGAFIDMEHTVFDLQLVGEMIRVADLTGITPIVRVPDNDAKLILRVLDMGAQGIQVPHIEGIEGARRAVNAVRYPPLGQRGGAGTTRAAGYGSLPWREHVQSSNEEILLIVMTEDLKGINDIEAIAALDGVDLISLGPTDLSTALGITDPKDPRLRQTVAELVRKVNRIGKARVYLPVYHAAFYLTPQELLQMGVSYTSVAPPPPTIVLNALRESAQRIREYKEDTIAATRDAWLQLTTEAPLEPGLPICDPHHHLWDRPKDRYCLDELLQDTNSGHNIVSTVFVECRSMYRKDGPQEMKPIGETEFVQGIAAQSASGQYGPTAAAAGIVGHANLAMGTAVARVLEAHLAASPNRFRGIRHSCSWDASPAIENAATNPGPGLLLDRTFQEGVACLQRYNLSFEAWLYHPQLPELAALARAVPGVTIILNHVGGLLGVGPYAGKRDEVLQVWKRGIAEVAACPNVVVKLGGLGMARCGFDWHTRAKPPTSTELAEATAPYYRYCIEQFGANRCMFESNFPVDKASYSYNVMWNSFKRMTQDCSATERAALFHDTSARAYRLASSPAS